MSKYDEPCVHLEGFDNADPLVSSNHMKHIEN